MPVHIPPVSLYPARQKNPETRLEEGVQQFNTEAKAVLTTSPGFNHAEGKLQKIAARILHEYNEYLCTRVADNRHRSDLWIEMKERLNTRTAMMLQKRFQVHERPVVDVLDIIRTSS